MSVKDWSLSSRFFKENTLIFSTNKMSPTVKNWVGEKCRKVNKLLEDSSHDVTCQNMTFLFSNFNLNPSDQHFSIMLAVAYI